MSWDIVLFSSSQKITSAEDIDESKFIPIMFSPVFESYFENFTKHEHHSEIKGDGFSIIYYYEDEPESNTLLNLYGESAIYPIIDLCIKNNWQVYDTGLDEMIDLSNPSKNGYQNFQAYLSQILNSKE